MENTVMMDLSDLEDLDFDNLPLSQITDQDLYAVGGLPRLAIPGQTHIPGPLVNQLPPSPSSGASPSSYQAQFPISDMAAELNGGEYATSPLSGSMGVPMVHAPNNNLLSVEDPYDGYRVFASDLKRLHTTIQRNVNQMAQPQVVIMKQQLQEFHLCWETLVNRRLGNGNESPHSDEGSPKETRGGRKKSIENFQCVVCSNGHLFKDRGPFRRHFVDLHQAPEIYYCGYCVHWKTGRRDKARLHLAQVHGMHKPSKDQLNQMAIPTHGPYRCEICQIQHRTWDRYFECIRRHCHVPSPSSPTDPSQDDDDGDDGDDDDFNNGGGGGGWSGYNNNQFTGNTYNTTGPQSFFPQGNGGGFSGGFAGNPGYNFHSHGANTYNCGSPGEQPLSECDHQDSDISSSGSSSFSPSAGNTTALDLESSVTPESRHDVLSSLEKVLPLRPKKAVSALSRALQEPQSGDSKSPGPSNQNTLSGQSLIPRKPDQSPCPDDDSSKDKCRSCNHQFDGCNKCRLQKQLDDKCHACADGVGLPKSDQIEPLCIKIPGSCINLMEAPTRPSGHYPSSNTCDTSVFDVVPGDQTINVDSTTTINEMSKKAKTVAVPWELISHQPEEPIFPETLSGKDYVCDDAMSPIFTPPASNLQVCDITSARCWTTDHQLHSKETGLGHSDIAFEYPADAAHPSFLGDVFADRLNRSAMLCDPALRMMIPFLFFYGSGFKADAGQNTLPNAALHGTSYIVQQMQHQQHDARLLQDAATSVTRIISHKRSSRLRKKLQVVAQILARYASVANASSETQTDTQALARKDPTGQSSDAVEVGGYGLDAQAFLQRVIEILSFLNAGMTESSSPEYTISKSDDDNEQLVMAFLLHILMVILRIPSQSLLTTGIVSC